MTDALLQALDEALDDEYKAMATYEAAIAAFGPIRPFINIVESERRHADALLQLYETYDLEPKPNRWRGKVSVPGSVTEACETAVAAEVDNAAMYDRLLRAVDREDVRRVFLELRRASQENHLPAFQRCAEQGVGCCGGQGRGADDGGQRCGSGGQNGHGRHGGGHGRGRCGGGDSHDGPRHDHGAGCGCGDVA